MDLTIWAVLVAAVSSFVVGGLRYSPMLFLNPWNKATNRSAKDQQPRAVKTCRPSSALFIDGGCRTFQFALYGVVLGLWR